MKTATYLLTGAFAALVSLPFNAVAEEGAGAKAPAETAAPASPAPERKMKPHSHMEEKGGVSHGASQAAPQGGAKKTHASRDKSRHFHPRDMK